MMTLAMIHLFVSQKKSTITLTERLLVKHVKDEALTRFLENLLKQQNRIPASLAPTLYFAACEVLGPGRTLGDEFAGVHRNGGRAKRILWVLVHAILLNFLGERIAAAVAKLNLSLFLANNGGFVSVVDRILRVRREITPKTISDQPPMKFPSWLRYVFAASLLVQGAAELAAVVREKMEEKEFEKAWNQANEPEETAGMTGTDETPSCTVCLQDCERPTAAKCGHIFCWSCAVLSFGKEPKCPSCRANTTIQELFPLEHYAVRSEPLWRIVRSID